MDQEPPDCFLGSSNTTCQFFSDFMARIAKFDELVDIGHRFLTEFYQEIELFRRPIPHQTSKVADDIIKANYTDRMKVYVESGCKHVDRDIQAISTLHACQHGLQDNIKKVKILLDELECLKEDAIGRMQIVNESISDFLDEKFGDGIAHQMLLYKEEEEEREQRPMHLQDKTISHAILMTVVFSMLSLDYAMQENIVRSLGLNTSSSNLEGYCLMWNLRPYVNDKIMRMAWKLVNVSQSSADLSNQPLMMI